jgi:hypothetical protein
MKQPAVNQILNPPGLFLEKRYPMSASPLERQVPPETYGGDLTGGERQRCARLCQTPIYGWCFAETPYNFRPTKCRSAS